MSLQDFETPVFNRGGIIITSDSASFSGNAIPLTTITDIKITNAIQIPFTKIHLKIWHLIIQIIAVMAIRVFFGNLAGIAASIIFVLICLLNIRHCLRAYVDEDRYYFEVASRDKSLIKNAAAALEQAVNNSKYRQGGN